MRHISQAKHPSACFGAQNDIAELFGRRKSPFHRKSVLIGGRTTVAGGSGCRQRLPDGSGADFHILRLYGLVHIGCGKVTDTQCCRVQPDTHGVVACSHYIDGAYTGHACQLVGQVQCGIITEVKSVVLLII